MLPTENYRRPWVSRDARTPNVVFPAKILKSYEEPESWWQEAKRRVHESMVGDLITIIAVGIGIFGLIMVLLHR